MLGDNLSDFSLDIVFDDFGGFELRQSDKLVVCVAIADIWREF